MTDPTQLLMDILSRKVSKKVDERIRSLVARDACLYCEEKKIWRDGNCTSCDHAITEMCKSIPSRSGRLKFMQGLYRDGKRLRPYEIRLYRKQESDLAKRAREAS